MLTIIRSSSYGRIAVASPSSVARRQTNPGARSASSLTGSSAALKPTITGPSIGPFASPTLSCASWYSIAGMLRGEDRGRDAVGRLELRPVADLSELGDRRGWEALFDPLRHVR